MGRKLSKSSREQIAAVVRRARHHADRGPLPDKRAAVLRAYCEDVAEDDLLASEPDYLAAAVLSHLNWARNRPPGVAKVRVFNPNPDRDGWHSENTVVQAVNDDMPFLVDSLTMCLNELGRGIQLTMHPILQVARTRAGRLTDIEPSSNGLTGRAESLIYLEIGKELDEGDLQRICTAVESTVKDVQAAVEDWPAMLEQLHAGSENLKRHGPRQPGVLEESCALIRWLADDHFTLLGCREYKLSKGQHKDRLVPVAGTGLGVLRDDPERPANSLDLRGLDQREARSRMPLLITKSRKRSTVHRSGHLDQISIKIFSRNGAAVGVRRLVGLYTSSAYNENPFDIPLLRLKIDEVMRQSDFDPKSHSGKALQHILNTFPRDDLFQISIADLSRISAGIFDLQERQQVRLLCRRDALSRYYSCFVYLPRDHYSARVRKRIEGILLESFNGTEIETKLTISESVLARLEASIRTGADHEGPPRLKAVENSLRTAVQSWSEQLRARLLERLDEDTALRLHDRFSQSFPVSYQEEVSPQLAAADLEDIAAVGDGQSRIEMSLTRSPNSSNGSLRLRTCRAGEAIPLYTIVPILERMSMKVLSERVYEIGASPSPIWIQELELAPAGTEPDDVAKLEPRFLEAFLASLDGRCENDEFNSFVVLAGLDWREVTLMRAYCKYLLQTGLPFSQSYMQQVLARYADFTRALVDRFQALFDPARRSAARRNLERASQLTIDAALDSAMNLDEDRILRAFLSMLEGTLRTNYFQLTDGAPKDYLVFKLDSAKLTELPRPRPALEIFVYSPRVEGVHLRTSRVARGGLRWSERREDFRTEILGLMKAQQVKNTIIVPTGAKGGFVCKQLPDGDRDVVQTEVIACYKTFVRGLLDVTDNIIGDRVVAPERVVRRDADDPYLVVAADKGTATFSDTANELSAEYGFWLGDAFASGGSAGYDHKKMGITAKGAWESVKRHFRELGINVQTEALTVVGIGDMGGDVFGNGMLLSKHIKLVAAFNHRHIFLDPDPDPAASYAERRRLFSLPRSGWDDYATDKLSTGGEVYSRQTKSIKLHAAAQAMLGIEESTLTPLELIRAILRMRVDLLWNGGIGTYVKATAESQGDAGDPANDAVRIDAGALNCKVVGEGGNLGLTQRARIEFTLNGGLVNADFIDNSAGVGSSDHEVNIKILLDEVIRRRKLSRAQRRPLLAAMTPSVAKLVLHNNYAQTQALSVMDAHSFARLGENARLIRTLETQVQMDRALEFLPNDETIAERRSIGKGLTRPELAVIFSYAKIGLTNQLMASKIPDDAYFDEAIETYFPPRLQKRFVPSMRAHRLRREIIAMRIANDIINRMGPAFTFRATEDMAVSIAQVVRAYTIVRDVFDIGPIWDSIEAADYKVPPRLQYELMFKISRSLRRAVYWLLQQHPGRLNVTELVARMRPGAETIASTLPELETPAGRERLQQQVRKLKTTGVSAKFASKLAALSVLTQTLDILTIAKNTTLDVGETASLYFEFADALEINWIRQEIENLVVEGRWQAVARDTLRQNLARQQSIVLERILKSRRRQAPRAALAGWLEKRREAIARICQIVQDMRAQDGADFATVSVAIREIERLG